MHFVAGNFFYGWVTFNIALTDFFKLMIRIISKPISFPNEVPNLGSLCKKCDMKKKSYFKSGMHFVAGNSVRPALTSARYSLCLCRISSLRSGCLLKPRPLTATPSGHWKPIPQYLQAVCESPPYQASQYFCLVSSLQIGFSTYYGKKNIKHTIERLWNKITCSRRL